MQLEVPNPEDFTTNAADKHLYVKFDIRSRPDPAATAAQGRPMFKDVEYIDIRVPGKKDSICRPATLADKDRFPAHYQAFKNRVSTEDVVEGTLLVEWPVISRSMADAFAFANIKTVEQLAGTADTQIQQFMGGMGLRRKAQEWLEGAAEGKAKAELQAELKQRDEQIAAMQVQLAELTKLVKAPKARKVTKKKRSRKKAAVKKE